MCFLCGETVGPFIDTGVEKDVVGHAYICASTPRRSGCSKQIGRLDGLFEPYSIEEINERLGRAIQMAAPALSEAITAQLEEALAAAEGLKALVEELAKTKLVPALEVYELGRAAAE